ncbi:MAG: hypothetical protein M3416_07360, partial [Acidobacteriota bacterium]|nr:hypothetical protein [Acidobacteriota bacterium]
VVDGSQDGVAGLGDHLAAEREDGADGEVAARLCFERELDGPPQVAQILAGIVISCAGHEKSRQ